MNDLETAIEEGSMIIRVGTAIFGRRPYPDSYYWNDKQRSQPTADTKAVYGQQNPYQTLFPRHWKTERQLVTAVWRNGGCRASYDSLVVGSGAVLRLNFCAKIRHYAKPQTLENMPK